MKGSTLHAPRSTIGPRRMNLARPPSQGFLTRFTGFSLFLPPVFIFAFASWGFPDEAPWAIEDAPYRAIFKVERLPKIPEAGTALVLPEFGHTQADSSDLVLTDSAGQTQPLAAVWRGEGQSVVLLGRDLKEGQEYAVYFGGYRNTRAEHWSPMVSLLMETRRIPVAPSEVKLDTFANFQKLWQLATVPDGAGFVPWIFQGNNPFGESFHFLTHYTGYLPAANSAKLFLYAQSSDACFVEVSNRLEISWPGVHGGGATPKTVPQKEVVVSGAYARVDYWHAKAGPGPPGMVMGWKRGEKYEQIPENAWVHPGAAKWLRTEASPGHPIPFPMIEGLSYLGYGGAFFFETKCQVPNQNLEGWNLQWTFDDGTLYSKPAFDRLIIGAKPGKVELKIRRGNEEWTGIRRFYLGGTPPAATVQKPEDVKRYQALFDQEDPSKWTADKIKACLPFLRSYGSEPALGRFFEALLQTGLPSDDPLWLEAQISRLRALSQKDSQAALADLRHLDPAARQKHSFPLGALELDLLAFELRDLNALKQMEETASRNPGTDLARLTVIRVGDLERLLGHYPEAAQQYQKAQPSSADSSLGRKIPTQDRAYSISVNDLLEKSYREEAKKKLLEWELAHPMAKMESDFLLLRARTLMEFGRWKSALAEIESFAKLQPDTPYEMDADFYRARALYELGQKDAARQLWRNIAAKYPQHPLAASSRDWLKKD